MELSNQNFKKNGNDRDIIRDYFTSPEARLLLYYKKRWVCIVWLPNKENW